MRQTWYITKDGKNRLGPFTSAQLRELVASGKLRPTDLVCRSDAAKWVPASAVRHLFPPAPRPSLRGRLLMVALPALLGLGGLLFYLVLLGSLGGPNKAGTSMDRNQTVDPIAAKNKSGSQVKPLLSDSKARSQVTSPDPPDRNHKPADDLLGTRSDLPGNSSEKRSYTREQFVEELVRLGCKYTADKPPSGTGSPRGLYTEITGDIALEDYIRSFGNPTERESRGLGKHEWTYHCSDGSVTLEGEITRGPILQLVGRVKLIRVGFF